MDKNFIFEEDLLNFMEEQLSKKDFILEGSLIEHHLIYNFLEGFARFFQIPRIIMEAKIYSSPARSLFWQGNEIIKRYYEKFLQTDEYKWVDIELFELAIREGKAEKPEYREFWPHKDFPLRKKAKLLEKFTRTSGKNFMTKTDELNELINKFIDVYWDRDASTEDQRKAMNDFETEVREGIDTLLIIYSNISSQYKKVSEGLVNHKFAFEKERKLQGFKVEDIGINTFATNRYNYHCEEIKKLDLQIETIFR